MNRSLKLALIAIAAVAGCWLLYAKVIKTMYLVPRAEAVARIEQASRTLSDYRKSAADHTRVKKEIEQFVDRTLGGDLETVDHKLRTRLNRLAEHAHLKGAAVGTSGAAKAKESPAKSRFSGTNRALREEHDFHELEAWASGTGTFEQVLQFIESIDAEPWIKRIDQLKLDPRDNGQRFNVNVKLTTLFLPKRTPNPQAAPPPKSGGAGRYAALLRSNPFRVPPAEDSPAVAKNTPPAPAAFAYEHWILTGVAQNTNSSGNAVEIWLLNSQTRESRTLAVGESLEECVLIDARGEVAEFRIGEQRFTVAVGANLGERTPVSHRTQ